MNFKKTLIFLLIIGCILLAFGWWQENNRIVDIGTGTGTIAISGTVICDTDEKVIVGNITITPDRSPSDGPKSMATIENESYKIGTGIDGFNFGGEYSGTMKLYEKLTDECQGRCVPGPMYCAKYIDFLSGVFTSNPPTAPLGGYEADDLSGLLEELTNLPDSTEYTVNLSDPQSSLPFDLNTGETITLLIQSPTPKTVVRVSQIIFPDGTMDGPFSSDTSFTATQKGKHVFIIRPNMMASEEVYTGNVTVKVTLITNN